MPKPQFSRFSKSRKESKSLPIVWIFVVVTVLFSFSDSITTLNISQYVPDTVGGVAMTSVMSSDNNRTTTSSTTTTKLRQSTQPTVGKFTWIDTEQPMLPLVSNFSGDINQFTNESIFYDPSIGYSFPCNGQNGRTDNIFYSHDKLRKQLLPGRVFTADQAIQCLSGASGGASALWIHIDGDSLARDMYYDLTEFFGMGWNAKKKTLEQQSFTAAAEFSFRGDTTTRHTRPTWMDMEQFEKRQGCPNVWIYESGLCEYNINRIGRLECRNVGSGFSSIVVYYYHDVFRGPSRQNFE